MAPEIEFKSFEYSVGYAAEKADIFSLGVVLYAIIFHEMPFKSNPK